MTVWRTSVSGCPPPGVRLPCPECPVACSGCPVAQAAIASPCGLPMSGCPVLPSESRYKSVCLPLPAPGRCSIPIRPRVASSEQTRRRWRTERPHMRAMRSWLGQHTPLSSACSARASRTSFGVAGRSSDQAHVDARSATRRALPRLPQCAGAPGAKRRSGASSPPSFPVSDAQYRWCGFDPAQYALLAVPGPDRRCSASP